MATTEPDRRWAAQWAFIADSARPKFRPLSPEETAMWDADDLERLEATTDVTGRASDECYVGNHSDCHDQYCQCNHHNIDRQYSGACADEDHNSCRMEGCPCVHHHFAFLRIIAQDGGGGDGGGGGGDAGGGGGDAGASAGATSSGTAECGSTTDTCNNGCGGTHANAAGCSSCGCRGFLFGGYPHGRYREPEHKKKHKKKKHAAIEHSYDDLSHEHGEVSPPQVRQHVWDHFAHLWDFHPTDEFDPEVKPEDPFDWNDRYEQLKAIHDREHGIKTADHVYDDDEPTCAEDNQPAIGEFLGQHVCKQHLEYALRDAPDKLAKAKEGIEMTAGPERLAFENQVQQIKGDIDKGEKALARAALAEEDTGGLERAAAAPPKRTDPDAEEGLAVYKAVQAEDEADARRKGLDQAAKAGYEGAEVKGTPKNTHANYWNVYMRAPRKVAQTQETNVYECERCGVQATHEAITKGGSGRLLCAEHAMSSKIAADAVGGVMRIFPIDASTALHGVEKRAHNDESGNCLRCGGRGRIADQFIEGGSSVCGWCQGGDANHLPRADGTYDVEPAPHPFPGDMEMELAFGCNKCIPRRLSSAKTAQPIDLTNRPLCKCEHPLDMHDEKGNCQAKGEFGCQCQIARPKAASKELPEWLREFAAKDKDSDDDDDEDPDKDEDDPANDPKNEYDYRRDQRLTSVVAQLTPGGFEKLRAMSTEEREQLEAHGLHYVQRIKDKDKVWTKEHATLPEADKGNKDALAYGFDSTLDLARDEKVSGFKPGDSSPDSPYKPKGPIELQDKGICPGPGCTTRIRTGEGFLVGDTRVCGQYCAENLMNERNKKTAQNLGCPNCFGSGSIGGGMVCPACFGTGHGGGLMLKGGSAKQAGGDGLDTLKSECSECGGTMRVEKHGDNQYWWHHDDPAKDADHQAYPTPNKTTSSKTANGNWDGKTREELEEMRQKAEDADDWGNENGLRYMQKTICNNCHLSGGEVKRDQEGMYVGTFHPRCMTDSDRYRTRYRHSPGDEEPLDADDDYGYEHFGSVRHAEVPQEGVLLGDDGSTFYTSDGGKNWDKIGHEGTYENGKYVHEVGGLPELPDPTEETIVDHLSGEHVYAPESHSAWGGDEANDPENLLDEHDWQHFHHNAGNLGDNVDHETIHHRHPNTRLGKVGQVAELADALLDGASNLLTPAGHECPGGCGCGKSVCSCPQCPAASGTQQVSAAKITAADDRKRPGFTEHDHTEPVADSDLFPHLAENHYDEDARDLGMLDLWWVSSPKTLREQHDRAHNKKMGATEHSPAEDEEDDDIKIFKFDHGPGQGNDLRHSEIHEREHLATEQEVMTGRGCGRCGSPNHTSERCPSNRGSTAPDSDGPSRYLDYSGFQPQSAAPKKEPAAPKKEPAAPKKGPKNKVEKSDPVAEHKKKVKKLKDDIIDAEDKVLDPVEKALKPAYHGKRVAHDETAGDPTNGLNPTKVICGECGGDRYLDASQWGDFGAHPCYHCFTTGQCTSDCPMCGTREGATNPGSGPIGTSIHDLVDNVPALEPFPTGQRPFITDHKGEVDALHEPDSCKFCEEPMQDHAQWNPTHQVGDPRRAKTAVPLHPKFPCGLCGATDTEGHSDVCKLNQEHYYGPYGIEESKVAEWEDENSRTGAVWDEIGWMDVPPVDKHARRGE